MIPSLSHQLQVILYCRLLSLNWGFQCWLWNWISGHLLVIMWAEYHIIDGAHPEVKAITFNKENIDWCCGEELSFDKITYGFAFVHWRKRVFEMFNDDSGYHLVPGTFGCLTSSMKKRKKSRKNKSDSTYERMLALHASKKGKSEYVRIWKKLREEFKNKNITWIDYFISNTFLWGKNNCHFPISSLTLELQQVMVFIELLSSVSFPLKSMKKPSQSSNISSLLL